MADTQGFAKPAKAIYRKTESTMIQTVKGITYNTKTANLICTFPRTPRQMHYALYVPCSWENTSLYHTKGDRYFLVRNTKPVIHWLVWLRSKLTNCPEVQPIGKVDAQEYAEMSRLTPEQLAAAGFEIEEG